MPSVPTTTSRAGKLARAAMPIRQSQPSGRTAGSIARPSRPRQLCRFHSPCSASISLSVGSLPSRLAGRPSPRPRPLSCRRAPSSSHPRPLATSIAAAVGVAVREVEQRPDERPSTPGSACRPGAGTPSRRRTSGAARSAATAACTAASPSRTPASRRAAASASAAAPPAGPRPGRSVHGEQRQPRHPPGVAVASRNAPISRM